VLPGAFSALPGEFSEPPGNIPARLGDIPPDGAAVAKRVDARAGIADEAAASVDIVGNDPDGTPGRRRVPFPSRSCAPAGRARLSGFQTQILPRTKIDRDAGVPGC
jgi:hypothetical protein